MSALVVYDCSQIRARPSGVSYMLPWSPPADWLQCSPKVCRAWGTPRQGGSSDRGTALVPWAALRIRVALGGRPVEGARPLAAPLPTVLQVAIDHRQHAIRRED